MYACPLWLAMHGVFICHEFYLYACPLWLDMQFEIFIFLYLFSLFDTALFLQCQDLVDVLQSIEWECAAEPYRLCVRLSSLCLDVYTTFDFLSIMAPALTYWLVN